MKKIFVHIVFIFAILWTACTSSDKYESVECVSDTIEMATISIDDTTGYFIGKDSVIKFDAKVQITYPKHFREKDKTEQLHKLFAQNVLGVNADSVSLATAFPLYVERKIAETCKSLIDEDDLIVEQGLAHCNISVKITPIYNNGVILSYRKVEDVTICDEIRNVKSIYSVFDLSEMKSLKLSDIIDEESILNLPNMLDAKLLKDYGAKNNDELADMGFYNIDNLEVSDNFYIIGDSVVWSYYPRELSIFGEVKISLALDDIRKSR